MLPIILLITLILAKQLPFFKGNISYALCAAGLFALLLGNCFSAQNLIDSAILGLDKLSWVIFLSLFGSIYAQTQIELKTLDLIIEIMRSKFGHSAKGLLCVIFVALCISGSLLGDAVASATVIGILVVEILYDMGLKPEEIVATITMGSSLGSIMPPISQSVFIASSLAEASLNHVINITYITILGALLICLIYASKKFIRINSLPDKLQTNSSVSKILKYNWVKLIPLTFLIALVVSTICFDKNIGLLLLPSLFNTISGIPIISGLTNNVVLILILTTLLSFSFRRVRQNSKQVFSQGIKNAIPGIKVQVSAAFFIGTFFIGGHIQAIKVFSSELSINMLRIGFAASELLMGLLTGSQSTAQNTILAFMAPILKQMGISAEHAALASAHIASGAQSLPPTSLTALVIASMVAGILNTKVNAIRSMVLCLPMCIYMILCGIVFLYY